LIEISLPRSVILNLDVKNIVESSTLLGAGLSSKIGREGIWVGFYVRLSIASFYKSY